MTPNAKGFTLIEVMIASLIATVVAAGTLMANVTAARIVRAESHTMYAEASAYAQQTTEQFRNMVACGEGQPGEWFDIATCNPIGVPLGWTNDALPAGGSESLTQYPNAKRCYRVTPTNCSGVNDCLQVEVSVCWNDLTGCPC